MVEKINLKIVLIAIMILIFIGVLLVFGINWYVKYSVKNRIILSTEIKDNDYDCILILGAGVWGDSPSPMLEERLNMGIELYKAGIAPKIIMSGDHGRTSYDEVNLMKQYAIDNGVPSVDIFMDHAGFSTYDSIYRARDIFKVKKMIIVTQEYHLYRALFIANKLDVNAHGVPSDKRVFNGQLLREIREIAARDKDFIKTIFKPKPKYLGESIPVSGNGDITNDKRI